MKLNDENWDALKNIIETTEYGKVIIFCSPAKKTLDFVVERTYKLPVDTGTGESEPRRRKR